MNSEARAIMVLHGASCEGPMCILCTFRGRKGPRPYCNAGNVVARERVHDEPLSCPLSCPVCEAYRQRLVRFWSLPHPTNYPEGSEGQRA